LQDIAILINFSTSTMISDNISTKPKVYLDTRVGCVPKIIELQRKGAFGALRLVLAFGNHLYKKFNLVDKWYRYEWQDRGSSRCHGTYWIEGASDPEDPQFANWRGEF
jgi:hypothetical protein